MENGNEAGIDRRDGMGFLREFPLECGRKSATIHHDQSAKMRRVERVREFHHLSWVLWWNAQARSTLL